MNIKNSNNDKRINVKINGASHGDVTITLNSGENLGFIQSVNINGCVGGLNTVRLESILEKADIDILQKQTEIKVLVPSHYYVFCWLYRLTKLLKLR